MKMSRNKFILIFLFSFGALGLVGAGCQQESFPDEPTVVERHLVRAELIATPTAAEIQGRFGNLPIISALIQHDLQVYRLVYNTQNVDGRVVQASGALLVPLVNKPLPLVSLQHGTITNDQAAPSHYNQNSESWTIGSVVAAGGYVVAAPDYLGYGESRDVPHPYEHAASLASASADMLRAAREFCQERKLQLDERLFLTGYSEGGYATMALHRHLETDLSEEFTVTASAPGAGAYHKSAFARFILKADKPLNFMNSYLWVLETYNQVYGLERPWSFFLREPYASRVQQNGIQASVNPNPQALFSPQFRDGVLKNTDLDMLEVLRDNDIHDWRPQAPISLFHGTADDYVPFFNSQNAYDAMRANGANKVQLVRLEGRNHGSAVPEFILGVVAFLSSY
jgi:pimeloyl-ACP methyl ester carboxylesterase